MKTQEIIEEVKHLKERLALLENQSKPRTCCSYEK